MDTNRLAEASRLNTPTAKKAPYAEPTLTAYGRIRDLTQSNSTHCTGDASGVMMNTCPSERHLKENIVEVGRHPLGIGLYLFDYKPEFREFGAGRQFGVMVDEVEGVMPEAISLHPSGCKQVNYTMLGIDRATY